MPKLLPSPDDASQCRRPLQREHPQHYGSAQRTRAWGGTCSASCVARPSLTCAVSCARSSRHRRCSCASAMRSLAASPSGAAWEMTYIITWPDLNECGLRVNRCQRCCGGSGCKHGRSELGRSCYGGCQGLKPSFAGELAARKRSPSYQRSSQQQVPANSSARRTAACLWQFGARAPPQVRRRPLQHRPPDPLAVQHLAPEREPGQRRALLERPAAGLPDVRS